MSHLWGPSLTAEVDYRRSKLARVASTGRRRQRRVRRLWVRAPSRADVTTPRAA